MASDEPLRQALFDSLTLELGKILVSDPSRRWSAGQILGAAAELRSRLAGGEGPFGVTCADPGWLVASLIAGWSLRRRPILLDPALRREVASLERSYPGIPVLALPLGESRETTLSAVPPWFVVPSADDAFAAVFTSGSEGENKVVDKQAGQFYRQGARFGEVLGLPAGCRVLSFVPLYHMLGCVYALFLPLVLRGETLIAAGLTGAAMVQLIARYHPHLVVGTATHYRYLVRDPAPPPVGLPRTTVFLSSGTPLDPGVAHAFAERYGTAVRENYGSTELAGVAWRRWPEPYRPWPGVSFRIQPDNGRLEVRSPWGGGAPDTWLPTDDAAEPAGEGCFRLLGRLSHLVKVGSKRFSSVEVEQALRTMPGVAEAAVLPYDRFGQAAIAALVVPEPGFELDADAVRAFLGARLADFKLPRTIRIVSGLPRGPLGKVDYTALRALAT